MERTGKALVVLVAVVLAVHAVSSAGTIYFTTESRCDFSHLWSYDTDTGQKTDRGVIQGRQYTTDLAFDPSGNLHGVGWNNSQANGSSKLYQITPGDADHRARWSMETVKSSKMDRTVNSAIFDGQGDLFVASDAGSFQKLTYDADRGRWKVEKTAWIGQPAGGDLAFSSDGSSLYVTLRGGELATIDFDVDSATFGQASVVGQTGYDDIFGLAMADGVLYGTTADGNYGPSHLVQIDPNTAATTFVADLGCGVWGAAGGSYGQPVPEPATLILIAVGALTMGFKKANSARGR